MKGRSTTCGTTLFSLRSTGRRTSILSYSFLTALLMLISANKAFSQGTHPGLAVYQQRCAVCHANPGDSRAPSFSSLQKMSAQTLRFALTKGVMQAQSSNIPTQQLNQVIEFLAKKTSGGDGYIDDIRSRSNN